MYIYTYAIKKSNNAKYDSLDKLRNSNTSHRFISSYNQSSIIL